VPKCSVCNTDEASEQHHIVPKAVGGRGKKTIPCCKDCGQQVHMLFTNKELASMQLHDLLCVPEMQHYIRWKRKHPGTHSHRMSNKVKSWKKRHR
jgi:hypothetical protein